MSTQKDAFSLQSLTASINALPFKPFRLGAMGLFSEMGIAETTAQVERLNGTLGIVGTAPRGAPGEVVIGNKRTSLTIAVPHIPALGGIGADELQNKRAFGAESQPDAVPAARDRALAKMRAALELTIEAHRVGALKGLVLDKDGSTLIDLFAAFGVTQNTVAMALGTAGTKVRVKASEAIRACESALGGVSASGYRAMCGTAFFDALSTHDNVEKFFVNTQMANAMGQSDPLQAVNFAGITWERYRGVTGCEIATDDAYLVPMGVPELFITRYAPANYVETVNTIGLPMYAQAEVRDMGKGYDLEAQTNPLNLCTRPNAVVKMTKV